MRDQDIQHQDDEDYFSVLLNLRLIRS